MKKKITCESHTPLDLYYSCCTWCPPLVIDILSPLSHETILSGSLSQAQWRFLMTTWALSQSTHLTKRPQIHQGQQPNCWVQNEEKSTSPGFCITLLNYSHVLASMLCALSISTMTTKSDHSLLHTLPMTTSAHHACVATTHIQVTKPKTQLIWFSLALLP
jgi:hypothetical protein